jgi:hypothetical protein
MHGQNTISIEQIANGWVVTLPFVFRPSHLEYEAQAHIFKKHFQPGDEVLENIKQQEQEEPKIYEMKTPNVYVFHTFSEMINFIAVNTCNMQILSYKPVNGKTVITIP